ncbi:MAG: hypothetical protein IPP93_14815 [Chitinophagaceae bacterium]|nr:hypothetical protein [Chitinophagaceae bacterium]
MNSENIPVASSPAPRFEFRSFGQDFEKANWRMARLSVPVPEKLWVRTSDEIYILSWNSDINNVKIRDGKMDIKTLVQTTDGLEQWNPVMKGEFPMHIDLLKNEVIAALHVQVPDWHKEYCSLDEFLGLVNLHPQLLSARIHKTRYAYMVNNTISETGIVLINGAKVFTVNSESTVIEDVKRTLRDTGLEGIENINYLQAIKRVTGMINKPLAN